MMAFSSVVESFFVFFCLSFLFPLSLSLPLLLLFLNGLLGSQWPKLGCVGLRLLLSPSNTKLQKRVGEVLITLNCKSSNAEGRLWLLLALVRLRWHLVAVLVGSNGEDLHCKPPPI